MITSLLSESIGERVGHESHNREEYCRRLLQYVQSSNVLCWEVPLCLYFPVSHDVTRDWCWLFRSWAYYDLSFSLLVALAQLGKTNRYVCIRLRHTVKFLHDNTEYATCQSWIAATSIERLSMALFSLGTVLFDSLGLEQLVLFNVLASSANPYNINLTLALYESDSYQRLRKRLHVWVHKLLLLCDSVWRTMFIPPHRIKITSFRSRACTQEGGSGTFWYHTSGDSLYKKCCSCL